MNNDLDEFLKDQDENFNNGYFDYDINNINPTDPFQNFFNPISNTKDYDIYSNYLINENINSILTDLQKEIQSLFLSNNFDEIIRLIENHFGNFFFQLNSDFLYLIMKIKFLMLLQLEQIQDAIKFYDQQFFPLIKSVKPYNWVNENKVFEKFIRNPEKLQNKNFLKIYYEKFQFQFNKSINKYLYNEDKEENFIVDEPTKANKIFHKTKKKKFSIKKEKEPTINLSIINDEQNKEKISLDNPSINLEYFKNQIENPTINQPIINLNNINEKGKDNSELTLYKQLPFLSSFKPHYAKRETIDKKIIRTFRQYLIEEHKKKSLDLNIYSTDNSFYISLIRGSILPPSTYYDNSTNENLCFKSFNSHFLLWFFSKEGIKELYSKFLNSQGNNFLKLVSEYYKLNQKESEQLNSYINNLPFIFDLTLVNNLTKGNNYMHMYRKQKNNKMKKKLLFKITKENKKKERSRSKKNDNLNKSSSSIEE